MVDKNFDGSLCESSKWTKEKAARLAAHEGITTLTDRHWETILFIRDYYEDFKQIPSINKICAYTGLRTMDIYKLFPGGPIKSACHIAGIPPEANLLIQNTNEEVEKC